MDNELEQMNRKRREEILEKHPYEIYQGAGKDTRWRTHVLDPIKKECRRMIVRKDRHLDQQYIAMHSPLYEPLKYREHS